MVSKQINFASLIAKFSVVQSRVEAQLDNLVKASGTTPAEFLQMQFNMAQVTQMGDSISNMISQINSMISTAVRNQKVQ